MGRKKFSIDKKSINKTKTEKLQDKLSVEYPIIIDMESKETKDIEFFNENYFTSQDTSFEIGWKSPKNKNKESLIMPAFDILNGMMPNECINNNISNTIKNEYIHANEQKLMDIQEAMNDEIIQLKYLSPSLKKNSHSTPLRKYTSLPNNECILLKLKTAISENKSIQIEVERQNYSNGFNSTSSNYKEKTDSYDIDLQDNYNMQNNFVPIKLFDTILRSKSVFELHDKTILVEDEEFKSITNFKSAVIDSFKEPICSVKNITASENMSNNNEDFVCIFNNCVDNGHLIDLQITNNPINYTANFDDLSFKKNVSNSNIYSNQNNNHLSDNVVKCTPCRTSNSLSTSTKLINKHTINVQNSLKNFEVINSNDLIDPWMNEDSFNDSLLGATQKIMDELYRTSPICFDKVSHKPNSIIKSNEGAVYNPKTYLLSSKFELASKFDNINNTKDMNNLGIKTNTNLNMYPTSFYNLNNSLTTIANTTCINAITSNMFYPQNLPMSINNLKSSNISDIDKPIKVIPNNLQMKSIPFTKLELIDTNLNKSNNLSKSSIYLLNNQINPVASKNINQHNNLSKNVNNTIGNCNIKEANLFFSVNSISSTNLTDHCLLKTGQINFTDSRNVKMIYNSKDVNSMDVGLDLSIFIDDWDTDNFELNVQQVNNVIPSDDSFKDMFLDKELYNIVNIVESQHSSKNENINTRPNQTDLDLPAELFEDFNVTLDNNIHLSINKKSLDLPNISSCLNFQQSISTTSNNDIPQHYFNMFTTAISTRKTNYFDSLFINSTTKSINTVVPLNSSESKHVLPSQKKSKLAFKSDNELNCDNMSIHNCICDNVTHFNKVNNSEQINKINKFDKSKNNANICTVIQSNNIAKNTLQRIKTISPISCQNSNIIDNDTLTACSFKSYLYVDDNYNTTMQSTVNINKPYLNSSHTFTEHCGKYNINQIESKKREALLKRAHKSIGRVTGFVK